MDGFLYGLLACVGKVLYCGIDVLDGCRRKIFKKVCANVVLEFWPIGVMPFTYDLQFGPWSGQVEEGKGGNQWLYEGSNKGLVREGPT